MLSASEHERYSRHILLNEVGEAGQLALKEARILIVGAGGLGCPVATYLAAAGVGTIGLVDDDVVELSNLQRQVLFSEADLGQAKVAAAARRLQACNANIVVVTHFERLTASNAQSLISAYDLVVDCSDNFATRYAINDACLLLGRSFVYGSIYRFEGQVSVFCQPSAPCYRCLFPQENAVVENCAEAGVVGVLAGVIGGLQATEALKILLGIGDSLAGKILLYDALALDFRVLNLSVGENCMCSKATIEPSRIAELSKLSKHSELSNSDGKTVEDCRSDSMHNIGSISVAQLRERLEANEKFELLDVRTTKENRIMRFGGSKLIAVDELESRLSEVSSNLPVIVYCRSGIRSLRAARLLRSKGHSEVLNLTGGILAWYREFQDYLLESDIVNAHAHE